MANNALAGLAERLGHIGDMDAQRKARSIVAELAKADSIYAADPVTNNCVKLQLEAFKNCRAIAAGEGGVK